MKTTLLILLLLSAIAVQRQPRIFRTIVRYQDSVTDTLTTAHAYETGAFLYVHECSCDATIITCTTK